MLLVVNGSVLRLVTGADIRITASGRLEIINAFDGKLVLGPHITTVTGTKTVSAPTMTYNATNYIINTTNYTLNANVAIFNTPTQTSNAADQSWLYKLWHSITYKRFRVFILATDVYGAKVQLSAANTMINGVFANWSLQFIIDAPVAIKFAMKERHIFGLKISLPKLKFTLNKATNRK